MQTSLTHGRRPIANARRLGVLEALCAAAMVPGTVVSALVYPILFLHAAWAFTVRDIPAEPVFWRNLQTGLAITLFGAGLVALIMPALLGGLRRGWMDLVQSVLWLPLYFALVSLAAWLALIELIRVPSRWNKTEHGLARHSRSGRLRPRRGAAQRARPPSVVRPWPTRSRS